MDIQEIFNRVENGVYDCPDGDKPELVWQFEYDTIAALMEEYHLNAAQARKAFAKGYEAGHAAGFFEVLNVAQEYGDFAASILDSIGKDKEAQSEAPEKAP